MLIIATTSASLPILIKQLLDSTFIQKDSALLQTTLLAMITLFIVRSVASSISIYTTTKASGQLGIDLRRDMFNKLLTLPVSFYTHFNKKSEVDRLVSSINQITHHTTRHITILVQDGLTIIGLVICILYLNHELTLLLLLVSPLPILIIQMTHDHLNKFNQKNLCASDNLIQHLLQSIQHCREIRLNGGQDHESHRLSKIAEPIYHAEIQQALSRAVLIPAGQITIALILIAMIYFLTQQIPDNPLSLDKAGAFLAAALLFINPIQRIANTPKQLEQDQRNIETLFLFLDQVSEQDTGTRSLEHVAGKLTFEQVRFCHDTQTKPILRHLNLTIKPHEAIVFTGYTDAEKNALIDLVLRLRQPTSGKILVDDQPLTEIQLNNLHANIGIITKDAALLDEKVAGNIAYGAMKCASEAKITAAAHASHAMEFIRQMPEGLQTRIGRNGARISKEQCQKIAIARVLLKNPSILILDEISATNQLDADDLCHALERLMQNRTTLIFNQDVPHLKKIDRVVVLKNGCITQNFTQGNAD
ncbi:ATP-binding cassette, subfamily B, MsbA [Nitrosomonas sp. Nm166]|nr:ATP-binding cassette, subfamily B, MsbA [Nitrosomonas sp. Nm166]